jgi:hypothetical protein
MIDRYTIKASPAVSHKEILRKLSEGKTLPANELENLSKVKAKIEVVGDYADIEKIRDLISTISKQ